MSIFQHYTGGSYYRDDELQKIENPNWASSQAQYDQYYRDVTQKAENRAAAEKAALQAILTGKVSGDGGSDVRLSGMAGFAGNAGFGGMAGKAGKAGKAGISSLVKGYEQGGEVIPKPNTQGFLRRSNTVNQPETTETRGGGFLVNRKMFKKLLKPIQKLEDLVPPEEQDEPTPPVDFRPYLISDLGRSFLDLNTFDYVDKDDDYMNDPIVRNYNQGGGVAPPPLSDPLAARGPYIDLPKKEEKPKPKTGGPTPFIRPNPIQVEGRSGGIETLIGALFGSKNQPTLSSKVHNSLGNKQQLFKRRGPTYDLVKTTSAAVDTSKIPMPDFSEDRKAYEELILADYEEPDFSNAYGDKEELAERGRQTYIKQQEEILKGMRDSGFKTGIPYFDLIAPTEQHVGTKTYNPYTGEYVENPHLSGIPSLVNRGVVRNKIF